MNLADIRKRHGLDERKTEQKSTTQTTTSHMLDEIRARHNLGKVSSTREKVEEAKAKPRLYKNEAEYYAANARPYDEVKAELDAVTARHNTYDNEKAMRDSGISGKVWQKRYGEKNTERISELAHLIEMENKRIDSLTKEAQYGRLKEYNDLANNEDFDVKSVYDKNAKATVANQLYRQVNDPLYSTVMNKDATGQMTADEVKIFNYIYNTQGDKAAQEYFDYLKTDAPDPLDARRGREIAGEIKTDVGRAIYGGIAAVDNTTQGVKQLFTSEAVKPTVAQYASAEAAEDIETKVGKFAYDLSATVGNMAPSILASTAVGIINPLLGKAVGSTLMGAASAGNTYTEAINSGMTPRQAMKYGTLVGASEAALESVLGGISKLGANPIGKAAGKLVSGSKFAKAIGAVDNAFIRAAAKLAGSMAGEIAEEELQLFLEPLFKTMATDEKYDAPEWEEIVYTALISAASAGLFEAPGNIAEAVQESKEKKAEKAKQAEKILNNAIAEHEKQSEAQSETDAANADFANEVLDENAEQTTEDAKTEEMPSNRATEAYTQMVQNYADSMDANGQNVFIEAYDGSVEPDVYVREMQDAYDAGRRGESLAANETAIGDDRRQLAYKAGIADKATADADYGFVHNEVSRTVDRKLVQDLNRIGKDLKVKIQFVDSVRGGAAQGSYRNGVVTISRRADDPYMVVAKHEITHHLEKVAPKAYAAYQAYAVETVAKGYGKTVDALVQDRIAVAARHGDRLTAAEARAEIAADFTEMIFADEKNLRQFVEANSKSAEGRNMLQRLWDAIRRFIASLKKTKVSIDAEAASKMGLGSVIDRLEQAEMLLREALKEGGKNKTGVSGDGKTQYVVKRANGKKIAWMEKSELTSKQLKDHKAVANYIADHIDDVYTIIESGQKVYIGEDLPSEYTQSKYTGYLKNRRKGDLIAKNKATNVLGDMIEIATNRRWEETEHPETKDAKYGMYRYDSSFAFPVRNEKGEIVNVKAFDVELLIRNASDKKKYLYDIVGIKENTTDALDLLKKETRKGSYETAAHGSVTTINISQSAPSVKSQNSTKGDGLDALRKQYGEIEPGENPTREAHVPRKTEKHKNVSQTVRTIIEAGVTPDIVLPNIEQLVANGTFSYESYGDKEAIANAEKRIKYDGWERSLTEWEKAVASGKVSKDLTTMGWVLYNNAVNKAKTTPDTEVRKERIKASVNILTAMVGQQRNAAQALQATRILKKLSPQAQLYGIVRSVESLQRELEKKHGNKAPNLKIDQVLAERVLTATTDKARDEAMHDIYRDIGRQMPSTFLDKWNAWRYLAMLGNVRTHVRNIAGNIIFTPFVWTKNLTASAIELAWKGIRKDKFQRTKALPSKDLIAAAYSDYVKLTEKQMAGDKYNENAVANEYINEGRQIFGQKTKFGKSVEAVRKFNSDMLSAEDAVAKRVHYSIAMAQYCKANGITAEMLTANNGAYDAKIDNARDYAMKEAKKATFNDANAVTQAVQQMAKIKGLDVLMDAVLPFRKTPVNILLRAIEYSPIGFAKSISFDIWQVYKGKKTAAEVIDGMAAGLTGMGLMVAGAILAKMGLIRGMNGEDEEERKFNELQGYQGYSLVAWDRTYTLDWLAPGAMPFFVGVNIAEAKALEEMNVADIVDMIGNVSAPLLDMSCLQSLNDMIEAIGTTYGSGLSALYKAPVNAATSYVTQALPTIFGQVERVTESTRQQTYTDKNNKVLTPDVQYTLGKALNKTFNPFDDVAQIPYIDAWGRETSTGNVGARAFNNLLNPGYSAKIRTSEMEKELQRLFDETGEKSVLPDRAAKYITVEGEKIDLNKNQYVKYATVKGQTAYDMLTKITASSQYKALDEQSKVDLISKVYSYANAIAKAEVTKTQKDKALRYQPDGWIEKAVATSKATGIPAWKYVLIYNGQTDIRGLTDKNGDTISLSSSLLMMEYLYGFIGLSDAQRQALYADFGVAKSVRHYDKQRVAQELKKMRAKAGK